MKPVVSWSAASSVGKSRAKPWRSWIPANASYTIRAVSSRSAGSIGRSVTDAWLVVVSIGAS